MVYFRGPELPDQCLAAGAVFDGVGGRPHGQLASALACQFLAQLIHRDVIRFRSHSDTEAELKEVMLQIHQRILERASQDPETRGMTTTGTVAFLADTVPPSIWIGHVGDGAAFLMREGKLAKLTRDDSLVMEMVDLGIVVSEEASSHPMRHVVTQTLGNDMKLVPHVYYEELRSRDRVLLCTDGLTTMVEEPEIRAHLSSSRPGTAAGGLVEAANDAGGRDNVTVVVFECL